MFEAVIATLDRKIENIASGDPRGQAERKASRKRASLGFRGGFIATVVMTLFRMPISLSPPPTANFWATYIGTEDPADYQLVGLILHLAYGVMGGIVFAMIAPGKGESDAMAETKNATVGSLYGFALSIFGLRIILERILDMNLAEDERLVFHLSHVIYGLTLGTWVGSRLGAE